MILGVIDSLSKGFNAISRHLWIILIPIFLDMFLWLGPQASVEELVTGAFQAVEQELTAVSAQDTELLGAFRDTLQEVIPQYNSFSMLRVGMLGVPSLLIWGGARLGSPSTYETLWVAFLGITNMPDLLVTVSDADFLRFPVWQIKSEALWLLLSMGLTLIGIAVGCVFMTAISKSVIESQENFGFWQRTLKTASRFVLFWLVRLVVLIALGIPFMLVFSVLSIFSLGLAALFSTIVLGMLTWLSFYLIFFIASLVINDISIWQALWNSFNVVLRNFWSTLWLFVLINLIGGGMTILWQQLSTGSWWTLLAIVGNAYVGTSLVAASLIFYQDRYHRWRQALAQVLSKSNKGMA
jgi:hypothetical protein